MRIQGQCSCDVASRMSHPELPCPSLIFASVPAESHRQLNHALHVIFATEQALPAILIYQTLSMSLRLLLLAFLQNCSNEIGLKI